jgi:glutathione synthase/RimK-type ligase-like ATP-grasp enzyme
MIIKSHKDLMAQYNQLSSGDIFVGSLVNQRLKPTVLIDLLERGVHCFPSPLSQTLSRSKVAQAFLLSTWMIPHTRAITRRAELVEAMPLFHQNDINAIVTKEDRMHCGHGIRKWDSIETLYSFSALLKSSYPFVLQPFLKDFMDVRVIVAGDWVDVYARENTNSFRKNLSFGGKSRPYPFTKEMKVFCSSIMERGKFPYAHIDLMIAPAGPIYLSEIALKGGSKGSTISLKRLNQKKNDILERLTRDAPNPANPETN